MARVGLPAPDFDLACIGPRSNDERRATLADYSGRWLLLVFYPRDFSFVCPTELTALSTRFEEIQQRECDVLAVSVDDLATHREWLRTRASEGGVSGLRFPLASDPDGSTATRYGVFVESERVAGRGLFILDPNGALQYQVVHNLSVGRSVDETLRVLDALRKGGLCPASWTRADGTIDPRLDLMPGRVWGSYRIERLLGEGGFGWVYAARDLLLDRPVAIKLGRTVLQATRQEVMQEARAAARLSHPNVCAIFAVQETDGVPMIVMEYLPGGSLAKRLEAGPLSHPEATRIATQVVRGVAASHAAGIVHGDIKPANILFDDAGEAKVGDFGLARDVTVASEMTDASDVIRGTPAYMSPEQAGGQVPTAASDVFSLGLLLFELFAGERAVRGSGPIETVAALADLDPALLAERLPEALQPLWRRMVAQRPDQRPSMKEVARLI